MTDTPKPTYYGITGADEKFIKENGLERNAAGELPRLDTLDAPVATIQTVDGFVRTDIPENELRLHIADAGKVLADLLALWSARGFAGLPQLPPMH